MFLDSVYPFLARWVQRRIAISIPEHELKKASDWYVEEDETFTVDVNQKKIIIWLLSDKKIIKLFIMLNKVEIEEYSMSSIQQIITNMDVDPNDIDMMFDRDSVEIKQVAIKFLNGHDLIINPPQINKRDNNAAFEKFTYKLRELL